MKENDIELVRIKSNSMMKGEGAVESIIALAFTLLILGIFFSMVFPATCHAFNESGAPNVGICAFYPTTSTTSTTTVSTTTSTSTSTSTTTIVYLGNCIPFMGFFCYNASLSQTNTLSITLEQFIEPTMYNVLAGCGDKFLPNGAPNATFYKEPFNLTKGQLQQLSNLSCSGASSGMFSGYLWLNYTKQPGALSQYNNSDYEVNVTRVIVPK